MKLRAVVFALAVPLLATPALAQADGCPPANTNVSTSPDGNTTTVIYDVFSVAASPNTTVSAECNMQARPGELGYSVYTVDHRASATLDEGQTATVTSTSPGGPPATATVTGTGPSTDIYDISNVGTNFVRQTIGRGPNEAVIIDVSLTAFGGTDLAPFDDARATIASTDIGLIARVSEDDMFGSIDQLAAQRAALMTHLNGSVGFLLLGGLEPIVGPSHFGGIAAVGSFMAGAEGRFNFGGLSLLGGGAFFQQSAAGGDASGAVVAGALRYVAPTGGTRWFGEAGVWGSPNLDLHFMRTYDNAAVIDPITLLPQTVTAEGDTTGSILGFYGRVGFLAATGPGSELALSATVGSTLLAVAGYTEDDAGGANVFAATIPDGFAHQNAAKVTAAWTTELTPNLDLTVTGSVGHTFGGSNTVPADVAFAGTIPGTFDNGMFVEYGARLGWNVGPAATISAFVAGTAGPGIGNHTMFGGSASIGF